MVGDENDEFTKDEILVDDISIEETDADDNIGKLDFHPDSGAKSWADAKQDETNPPFPGPSSENRTQFIPTDSDDWKKWKEMESIDRGKWSLGYRSEKRRQWRIVDVETFSNKLYIPDFGQKWIIQQLERDDLKMHPDEETVILALITVYFNKYEDMDIRPMSALSPDDDKRVETYENIRKNCGVARDDVKQVRKKI